VEHRGLPRAREGWRRAGLGRALASVSPNRRPGVAFTITAAGRPAEPDRRGTRRGRRRRPRDRSRPGRRAGRWSRPSRRSGRVRRPRRLVHADVGRVRAGDPWRWNPGRSSRTAWGPGDADRRIIGAKGRPPREGRGGVIVFIHRRRELTRGLAALSSPTPPPGRTRAVTDRSRAVRARRSASAPVAPGPVLRPDAAATQPWRQRQASRKALGMPRCAADVLGP